MLIAKYVNILCNYVCHITHLFFQSSTVIYILIEKKQINYFKMLKKNARLLNFIC